MNSIFSSINVNQFVIPIISAIITPVVEIVIQNIMEKNRSKKRKIRFFISELLFKGFKTDSQGKIEETNGKKIKQYQLDGYLVCEQHQDISSLTFQLPNNEPNNEEKICNWNRGLIVKCNAQPNAKVLKDKENGNGTQQPQPVIKNNEMEFCINNTMSIDSRSGIHVIGDYTSTDNLNLLDEKSFYVKVGKNDGGTTEAIVQKCPNIRKKWLIFYIIFSMVIIFLGVASLMVCFEGENWELIKGASSNLQWVLRIYGVLFLFITAFFVAVIWKCLSAYYVLIKMKKFGIPPKKPRIPVAETMLVPRIFQYMTGTEIVDNLL